MSTTQENSTAPVAPPNPPTVSMSEHGKGMAMRTVEDMTNIAKAIIKAGFAPKGMETIPQLVIALQYGAELGLSPMASLQNLAVINGRPTIYGDAATALVRGSGKLARAEELYDGTPGSDAYEAVCKVWRKGEGDVPIVGRFSIADAKLAGLWGKSGPWKQYPRRMLMWRARSWAYRDGFADVLRGLSFFEEMRDVPAGDYTVLASTARVERTADFLSAPAKADEPEAPATEETTEGQAERRGPDVDWNDVMGDPALEGQEH